MTQIEYALKGIITKEMEAVASEENLHPETIMKGVADGVIVIMKNVIHNIRPLGVGKGLRTKVNANIGTSKDMVDIEAELKKLRIAERYGADAIMDLSTGGPVKEMRLSLLKHSNITVGTVPVYEAALRAYDEYGSIRYMKEDILFDVIEEHLKHGVDFITVHCGITLKSIESLRNEKRILDIVSRGGSILFEWMLCNEKENPLYRDFDRLLEIAKKYDATLSLGDGMRPGSILDASDKSQFEELLTLGELRDYAMKSGVQTIIEGPGHVPLNQIEMNIRLEKQICKGAPFYVLGPLVTDVAVGYDHIAAAIGGAMAAWFGADFLCYVTPSEHVRLPDINDVREGVIASKIAAHAADIAKGIPSAIERDRKMSIMRKRLDWDGQISLSFDPEKVSMMRQSIPPLENDVCSMCGEFCAIKTVKRALGEL